jgi:hypothetical protein
MAQIDFFLCKDERAEFAKLVLGMGSKMIADLHYEKQVFTSIDNIDKFNKYIDKNKGVFIVNEKTFHHPFIFDSFEKNGKKKFYIQQRYGGPSFYFYSPGMTETEKKIGPGVLSNYPFYYDQAGEKFYPSETDKETFKILVSYIKKHTKPAKLSKRTFWIGNKSIVLCRNSGFQLIDIGGKNLLDYL